MPDGDWGGSRKDAGRKPIYTNPMGKRVDIWLTPQQRKHIERVKGTLTISAYIRQLIEDDLKLHQGTE